MMSMVFWRTCKGALFGMSMHGSTSSVNFNLFQGNEGLYLITSLKIKNIDYLPVTSKATWRIQYSGAECLCFGLAFPFKVTLVFH